METNLLNTEYLTVEPDSCSAVVGAVNILLSGGVVAFPTETVYGIGASLSAYSAIKRIFQIKGRSAGNPLAAHISDLNQVGLLCEFIPDLFYKLAERFLPGPLSIVLNKRPAISPLITANLDTIGIRYPNHKTALEIIGRYGEPVAATSANISGQPPLLSGKDVYDTFKGKLSAVIEDDSDILGIASTVISLAGSKPRLIRLGAICKDEIEDVICEKLIDGAE